MWIPSNRLCNKQYCVCYSDNRTVKDFMDIKAKQSSNMIFKITLERKDPQTQE